MSPVSGVPALLVLTISSLAVRGTDQPGPAGAEIAQRRLREALLETFNRTELTVQGIGQIATGRTLVRREALPVESVVPGLGGIVEDGIRLPGRVGTGAHQCFEGQGLQFGVLDQSSLSLLI